MNPHPTVTANYERWKENLLDTSKRNRLLYFKPDAAVQLIEPGLDELWNRLVSKGKPQSLFGLESENELFTETESEGEFDILPQQSLKSDEIRPNLTGSKLSRILYGLRSKSNLSLEEQGFTTLYVAWGFLKWRDPKTGDDLTSPLVLSPMTLLRESSRSAYRLKLYEEDLWLNPVLEWKLASDFKIQLPELPSFDSTHPFDYFDSVRYAVAKQKGWSVWEAAYLGLYSFHKMAMYQDLRDNEQRALVHPFVSALGGDASHLPELPATITSGPELDTIPVQQNFSVLDCDSSQGDAVQAAKAGVSFVLQGPPGTGKSQTITNIIAECLAAGKRVLFVSEKMAALDVVHERLKNVGLDLFCLKAHSQSAIKKEVIADLGRTLAAARTGTQNQAAQTAARQDSTDAAELERLRAGLNRFARELHQPRSEQERSVYEVVGELTIREQALEVIAPLPFPFVQDKTVYKQKRNSLQNAIREHETWKQGETHPWHGAKLQEFSLDLVATIRARANRAVSGSQAVAQQAEKLAGMLGLEAQNYSLNQAHALPELARLMSQLGDLSIPAMWFVLDDLEPRFALAGNFKSRFNGVAERRNALERSYQEEFWQLAHAEIIEQVKARHSSTLDRAGLWEEFPQWCEELLERLDDFASHLEKALGAATVIANALALQPPHNLETLEKVAKALLHLNTEFVLKQRYVRESWLDPTQQPHLRALCEAAKNQALGRDQAAKQLEAYDLVEMERLDLKAWAKRFQQDYGSPLRILKGAFRTDMRQLQGWRQDGQKLSFESAQHDLKIAAHWQEQKNILATASVAHMEAFGLAYEGAQTRWEKIEGDLAASRGLSEAWTPVGGLSARCISYLEKGSGLSEALAPLETLTALTQFLKAEQSQLARLFSLHNLPFERDGLTLSTAYVPLPDFIAWLKQQSANLRDVSAGFQLLLSRQKTPDFVPEQLLNDAQEALEILRIESELLQEGSQLQTQFESLFDGLDTNWDRILEALNWTSQTLDWWKRFDGLGGKTGENAQATPDFIARVEGDFSWEDVAAQGESLRDLLKDSQQDWEYFNGLFEFPKGPKESLATDTGWFKEHADKAGEIENYLRWRRQEHELDLLGLKEFWEQARLQNVEPEELLDAYDRRFWSLWLDGALSRSPALQEFVGMRHSASVEKFVQLDASSLLSARRRLSALLWDKKPVSITGLTRGGEIATLQKEVVKRARHKPLRRLFREIPHLLSALKPCVLMSPLAVAQFLEVERALFDVVIFDEASQICPEDAVGSILRADQMIVVGDRRQLPPTRFFASGGVFDEDSEEETDDGVFESVLDMCAPHLPGFMLLWHYRSRDEALISFSNRHFYDGRLITFPGPHMGGAHGRGVRLEWVSGIYYRGKGSEARTNPIEAKRVAELVMEHFERAPSQSLGVIALNAQHARAIDEAVRRELMEYPHLENLLDERRSERFFVKALENVQGDERDVIILSIGFGPDVDGKLTMNFGPLNREGGERRLNVAVTRARDALTVVSSMQPEDINTAKITRQGPKLLLAYLEMARRGGDSFDLQGIDSREAFVDAVEAALQSRNWRVHRGVGRSALKIDLAIEHPEKPSTFVMGIECDGGDYNTAPTARDRERLRPAVLSGLGWKLNRVWCLDWLKNPQGELNRLDALLKSAVEGDDITAQHEAVVDALPVEDLLSANGSASFFNGNLSTDSQEKDVSVLESGVEDLSGLLPVSTHFKLETVEDFVPELNLGLDLHESISVDNLPEYHALDLGYLGSPESFRALTPNTPKLRNEILQLVEANGPIALTTVVRRLSQAYGFGRAGATIRQTIIEAMRRDNRLQIRGDFAWLRGAVIAPLRVPGLNGDVRPIEEVCSEEIQEAAIYCLSSAFGMEREELIAQTARLLGWTRVGAQVRPRLQATIDELVRDGRLLETDGALRVVEN